MLQYFKIALCCPLALTLFLIVSFTYTVQMDPKITKPITPILLIHGSGSNQREWTLFKFFLESDHTGHIFTLNLNNYPFQNDFNRNITDYADVSVSSKILSISELYATQNINMTEIILIGNSMGGLISGAYCLSPNRNITIKSLITLSTPWHGSPIADYVCDDQMSPEKFFRSDSYDRKQLINKFNQLIQTEPISVYNYGSTSDWIVPTSRAMLYGSSGSLINNRNDHYTTVIDYELAVYIRQNWIIPHTDIMSNMVR